MITTTIQQTTLSTALNTDKSKVPAYKYVYRLYDYTFKPKDDTTTIEQVTDIPATTEQVVEISTTTASPIKQQKEDSAVIEFDPTLSYYTQRLSLQKVNISR